jgi:hypothetical protein
VKIKEGTDTKFGTCGKSPRSIAKCAYEAHDTALRVFHPWLFYYNPG